jgi:hypothetical protein
LFIPWSVVAVVVGYILWDDYDIKRNWRRKKKYGDEWAAINQAHAHLWHLAGISTADKTLIKTTFEQSLTQLTEVFSRLTGTLCSASIKMLLQSFKVYRFDAVIGTYARDCGSLNTRANPDYPGPVTLEENTDFKLIAQNLKKGNPVPYFFSNDLLKDALKGYRNSRFPAEFYNTVKAQPPARAYNLLKKFWPLEYRSAIVVPIFPLQADKDYDLVGFLCIDSPKTKAFLPCDVEILRNLAAAMYAYNGLINAFGDDSRDRRTTKLVVTP